MLIVYILMIICRYFGPSFRGRDVQLPDYAHNSVPTRGSGVVLDSFKNSEYDQEIPHLQTADKPVGRTSDSMTVPTERLIY